MTETSSYSRINNTITLFALVDINTENIYFRYCFFVYSSNSYPITRQCPLPSLHLLLIRHRQLQIARMEYIIQLLCKLLNFNSHSSFDSKRNNNKRIRTSWLLFEQSLLHNNVYVI